MFISRDAIKNNVEIVKSAKHFGKLLFPFLLPTYTVTHALMTGTFRYCYLEPETHSNTGVLLCAWVSPLSSQFWTAKLNTVTNNTQHAVTFISKTVIEKCRYQLWRTCCRSTNTVEWTTSSLRNPTNMFPTQPFMTTANLQDLGVFLSSWIFGCVQLN